MKPKIGRNTAQRRALYRGLVASIIRHGKIRTTESRAKAVRPLTERMITLGKRGDLHARRLAAAYLADEEAVKKLFAEVAPRYAERNGGYVRVLKLGPRRGDAAPMAQIELV